MTCPGLYASGQQVLPVLGVLALRRAGIAEGVACVRSRCSRKAARVVTAAACILPGPRRLLRALCGCEWRSLSLREFRLRRTGRRPAVSGTWRVRRQGVHTAPPHPPDEAMSNRGGPKVEAGGILHHCCASDTDCSADVRRRTYRYRTTHALLYSNPRKPEKKENFRGGGRRCVSFRRGVSAGGRRGHRLGPPIPFHFFRILGIVSGERPVLRPSFCCCGRAPVWESATPSTQEMGISQHGSTKTGRFDKKLKNSCETAEIALDRCRLLRYIVYGDLWRLVPPAAGNWCTRKKTCFFPRFCRTNPSVKEQTVRDRTPRLGCYGYEPGAVTVGKSVITLLEAPCRRPAPDKVSRAAPLRHHLC